MFRFAYTFLRRILPARSPRLPVADLPRPDPVTRPVARPRRAGGRWVWRPSSEEVCDALTLQPLPAGVRVTRCLDCGAAYGPDSLASLLHANDGRCLSCGTKRVTARSRRAVLVIR